MFIEMSVASSSPQRPTNIHFRKIPATTGVTTCGRKFSSEISRTPRDSAYSAKASAMPTTSCSATLAPTMINVVTRSAQKRCSLKQPA